MPYVPHHVWENFELEIPPTGLNSDTNLRELRTKCKRCLHNGLVPDNPDFGVVSLSRSTHLNHRRNCINNRTWGGEPGTDIWQHFTLDPPEITGEINPGLLITRCNYCSTGLHFSPTKHLQHNTGNKCEFMINVPVDSDDEDEEDDENQLQNVENLEPNVDNQVQDLVAHSQNLENPQPNEDNQDQNEENREQNANNNSEQNVDNEGYDENADSIADALKNVTI